ncbi:PREDICTED: uncharacterized protein LOC105570716 [Vollenhovia emeryi]|uniref:uncharacterized protein LOC105570716 n=1 Tax=Vollenhovia emeryi TaxID=411798 RepID=UPI0005F48AEB|nr:PREDICTED: uncharacterized protein LOC105570716 [Vollenhovia emeryi]
MYIAGPREEKRTGSGSIRRASERDGVIEGDRGNGEAAALLSVHNRKPIIRNEHEGAGDRGTCGDRGAICSDRALLRIIDRRDVVHRVKKKKMFAAVCFPLDVDYTVVDVVSRATLTIPIGSRKRRDTRDYANGLCKVVNQVSET